MIFPTALKQKGKFELEIDWNDGHHSTYHVRNLRLQCRCASCVDEWTREVRLQEADVPIDIFPQNIQSVGRYALNFSWSDGHNTGYYPFEHLRVLCECPTCQKKSS